MLTLGREIYEQTNQSTGEKYTLSAMYNMALPYVMWIENNTSSHAIVSVR